MLPSPAGPAFKSGVGLFETDVSTLGVWLQALMGDGWSFSRPGFSGELDVTEALAPSSRPSHLTHVCVGLSKRWTAVFNNRVHGTDVGLLPAHAASDLGCRSIRAMDQDVRHGGAVTRVLEVHVPHGPPPLLLERSVGVIRDGARWVFETSGTPYDFEETDAYEQPREAERLTSSMVQRYLRALGVPIDDPVDWRDAVQIDRTTT